MKSTWKSAMAAGCAALALGGTLTTARPAAASPDGAKNTTIGLGAATIIEALRGKKTEALILGAGTAYAAKKYEDERKRDRDKHTYGDYRSQNNSRSRDNSRYHDSSDDYENYGDQNGRDSDYRDYRNQDNQDYRNADNRDFRHMTGRRGNDNAPNYDRNLGGQRRGWNSRSLPPGQYKKQHRGDKC